MCSAKKTFLQSLCVCLIAGWLHCLLEEERSRTSPSLPACWGPRCCRPTWSCRTSTSPPSEASRWFLSTELRDCMCVRAFMCVFECVCVYFLSSRLAEKMFPILIVTFCIFLKNVSGAEFELLDEITWFNSVLALNVWCRQECKPCLFYLNMLLFILLLEPWILKGLKWFAECCALIKSLTSAILAVCEGLKS